MTATSMTQDALHPMPRWSAVAREQVRSVGGVLRRAGMISAGLLLLIVWGRVSSVAATLRDHALDTDPSHHWLATNLVFDTDFGILTALAAFLLPLAVWRGESAAKRWYHAAMPVNEMAHTFTKVAAGWGWLMLGVLVFDLALGATGMIGARMASGTPLTVVYPHAPGDLWQWLVPFTAATLAYLFGSAVVLASKYPWRWIFGVIAGYTLASSLVSQYVAPGPNAWRAYDLLNGDVGLYATITGQTAVMRTSRTLHTATGEAWVFTQWTPDVRTWIIGTLLWGVAGGALLWYAISRRRDAA